MSICRDCKHRTTCEGYGELISCIFTRTGRYEKEDNNG